MLFRKKDSHKSDKGAAVPASTGQSAVNITLQEAVLTEKPQRRVFPGPRGAKSPLRVGIDRAANAELIAHAKESLNAEICGVLAGSICEDDEGLFVHVQAAIRG